MEGNETIRLGMGVNWHVKNQKVVRTRDQNEFHKFEPEIVSRLTLAGLKRHQRQLSQLSVHA